MKRQIHSNKKQKAVWNDKKANFLRIEAKSSRIMKCMQMSDKHRPFDYMCINKNKKLNKTVWEVCHQIVSEYHT